MFTIVRSIIVDLKEVEPMVADKLSQEVMPMVLPTSMEIIAQGGGEKEEGRTTWKRYLDSPLSQCKGRKKRPALLKPIIMFNARQRRTCNYCHTKEEHNIRTCPKVFTVHNLNIIFY